MVTWNQILKTGIFLLELLEISYSLFFTDRYFQAIYSINRIKSDKFLIKIPICNQIADFLIF
jgi:hypothetical protein